MGDVARNLFDALIHDAVYGHDPVNINRQIGENLKSMAAIEKVLVNAEAYVANEEPFLDPHKFGYVHQATVGIANRLQELKDDNVQSSEEKLEEARKYDAMLDRVLVCTTIMMQRPLPPTMPLANRTKHADVGLQNRVLAEITEKNNKLAAIFYT
jgi:hypothetical protein